MLECERAFLESFGYTVLTAPSGGKGLELASIFAVDVVILDHFMPARNGYEVAMEMKRLRPKAPIILLTEGLGVPERTLSLVDALVPKRSLWPASCCPQSNTCTDADEYRRPRMTHKGGKSRLMRISFAGQPCYRQDAILTSACGLFSLDYPAEQRSCGKAHGERSCNR